MPPKQQTRQTTKPTAVNVKFTMPPARPAAAINHVATSHDKHDKHDKHTKHKQDLSHICSRPERHYKETHPELFTRGEQVRRFDSDIHSKAHSRAVSKWASQRITTPHELLVATSRPYVYSYYSLVPQQFTVPHNWWPTSAYLQAASSSWSSPENMGPTPARLGALTKLRNNECYPPEWYED